MKKVLIGCAIAAGVFIILAAVGVALVLHYAMPGIRQAVGRTSAPPPGITTGAGELAKSQFANARSVGVVTDILLRPDGMQISGVHGAAIIGPNGAVKSPARFGNDSCDTTIVESKTGGQLQYLSRGDWSSPAELFDSSGRSLWTYGGNPGVDDCAPGDINGDGKPEFAVGFNGGGGIRLLDSSGKKLWRRADGNVWHVEMADVNGDGRLEIVHSNAGGQITVRDGRGNVISRTKPEAYFSHFGLCHWPGRTGPQYVVQPGDGRIYVFGFLGRTAASLKAPKCSFLAGASAISVRLVAGQPDYFAVNVRYSQPERSTLYVYAGTGKLVYQETLPEACGALAVVPDGSSGAEALIVGGDGKLWHYAAAPGAKL